jgi:hypothetical protein
VGLAQLSRTLAAQLAITDHHVLLAGQAFQADRAAGMQLVGGNADFRTQAVLEAIGKAGRVLIITDAESTSAMNAGLHPGVR